MDLHFEREIEFRIKNERKKEREGRERKKEEEGGSTKRKLFLIKGLFFKLKRIFIKLINHIFDINTMLFVS